MTDVRYTTKDGEKLDVICFKGYGFTDNAFENTLYDAINYDLTTAEVFSAGVNIELPIITPNEIQTSYSLWD